MDSIEHHLYDCVISNRFWNQHKIWMVDNLNLGIKLWTPHLLTNISTINNEEMEPLVDNFWAVI